jgi:Spy/CpxP family protein refolding chaperone
MKRIIPILCAFILALPIMAWPQVQQERLELTPWWNRPIVRNLGLSNDQMKQVRTIIRDSRDRLLQLRAAVGSAEGALSDEFGEDPINRSKAETAIEKVVSARGELMRAVSQMSLRLRQVLTYSQWQELRKRETERVLSTLPKRQRARGGVGN